MIYAVGPDGDGDRIDPMRPWPALLRFALAVMVMLAFGLGGGVMVIWLVLAPNIPTGVAADELRAPFPAQIGQTLDQHGAGPPPTVTEQPAVIPPTAEQPVIQGADRMSTIVKERPAARPQMMAPVAYHTGHRLRCAHNAASVR